MKIVFASRTGNVESIVEKLGIEDAVKVESGDETVDGDFVFITYTDGYGDIPAEVEDFLSDHKDAIKGVIVSGDQGYGDAFCGAGDTIAEEYSVPCLYKVENDGTDEDIEKIKEILSSL